MGNTISVSTTVEEYSINVIEQIERQVVIAQEAQRQLIIQDIKKVEVPQPKRE